MVQSSFGAGIQNLSVVEGSGFTRNVEFVEWRMWSPQSTLREPQGPTKHTSRKFAGNSSCHDGV